MVFKTTAIDHSAIPPSPNFHIFFEIRAIERLRRSAAFDGRNLRLAQAADLVLLPTALARDDLEPTVLLAHELIKKNFSERRIAFALRRTGDSLIEVLEAQR